MNARDALVILPALRARPGDGDRMVLTGKFLDGLREYAARWLGPVTVWMYRAEDADTNLDPVEVAPRHGNLSLRWLPEADADPDEVLDNARVVLASLVDQHLVWSEACTCAGVPLVFVSEYTLRTRRQIIRCETSNPLLRLRREIWTTGMERRIHHALGRAAGIQCNGTPTYEAYRAVTPRPLLYFDSRIDPADLASTEAIEERQSRLLAGHPLRLAFSGRLIAMKGADHLLLVAAELNRLGVPFQLDIFGGGSLADHLACRIQKLGLSERVRLRGVFDFRSELLPTMTREVDLFVSCHRQGDPSCTYLETMACGVPVAGYANEAFAGLVRTSGVGWLSPLDDPRRLAGLIADLDKQRSTLAKAATRARAFAELHTLDRTMDARVGHLSECCVDHERVDRECRNSA